MTQLAILGGEPIRREPFPAYNPIGAEEREAVIRVIDSGVLSSFLGEWHPHFYGGSQVRAFETEWASGLGCRYAISVNSCTSGLYAAVGAARVGPGDEVIVSPYTMSASALAPVIFNAVPVFADLDPRTFCLDPESIRARITPRTRAIIVVHLFGQATDMDPIMALAAEHRLVVIEDCAQAPFATYKGRPVGTLGHIGVFSFNYHKHIHTGEGGMITTDDEDLAERMRYIRNHGEAVVDARGVDDIVNLLGFNFRLGEMEAAIGRCQIRKAPSLVTERQQNVRYLESAIDDLEGLAMPHVPETNSHVYYMHVIGYDESMLGMPRDSFVQALAAELPVTRMREEEGPLIAPGYVRPLYLQPIYQRLTAYGEVSCPFHCPHYQGRVDYREGLCPVAEHSYRTVFLHEWIRPPMTRRDLDDVAAAFRKVHAQRASLAGLGVPPVRIRHLGENDRLR